MKKIIYFLHRLEDSILIGILSLMLFMAVFQIILRNFFSSGVLWGQAMIRILVLWVGLLGAMVATRDNNHINIDILSRYLPKNLRNISHLIIQLFAASACGVMSWLSFRFVRSEMEYETIAYANIPAWVCESIIPIAFFVICIRYLIMAVTSIINLRRIKN